MSEVVPIRNGPVCSGCGAPSPMMLCDRCRTDRAAKRAAEALASIPKGYRWATLENPALRGAVKLARNGPTFDDVLRSIRESERVVVWGPQGSGKTALLTALLRERAPDVLWLSARKLGPARIQHPAGHGEPPLVRRACDAGLLLLDDVGEEGKMVTNALPDVVDERFAQALATWITTGRSGTEITELYGGGIMRRFYERAYTLHLGLP